MIVIKFNLICDEKPVRTIEDLQNNFSIEDVLAYYNNKLLHRWLNVRGYDSELEAVSAITSSDPMEIIKELIRIFDVVADEEKVEESIYMLKYLDERKELCAIYEQENYKAKNIIDDYAAGYRQLVEGILENPNDVAVIKSNIAEMVSDYSWILELNHRELFYALINTEGYLAIMCLLMNETAREYYLPLPLYDDNDYDTRDGNDDTHDANYGGSNDKSKMYTIICNIINDEDCRRSLGKQLISFAGETDGYWKDLEPEGKKYMILRIEGGNFVRSANKRGEELGDRDINNTFIILNGIDYKSNYPNDELLYMEV